MPRLFTIGYEKLLPPELVNELRLAGVERLIDVRHRAQSRRPGMSKTRLSELLADHDIAYEHRRALGTPPDIRWFFKNKREAEGREQFRAHVEATAAAELDALAGVTSRTCSPTASASSSSGPSARRTASESPAPFPRAGAGGGAARERPSWWAPARSSS